MSQAPLYQPTPHKTFEPDVAERHGLRGEYATKQWLERSQEGGCEAILHPKGIYEIDVIAFPKQTNQIITAEAEVKTHWTEGPYPARLLPLHIPMRKLSMLASWAMSTECYYFAWRSDCKACVYVNINKLICTKALSTCVESNNRLDNEVFIAVNRSHIRGDI